MRALRERDRERTADIREAIYERPVGRGKHLVKNQSNDTLYKVGSLVGITFTKGSKVLLGSNTGHPGEVILGGPPPGKRGGGTFGTVTNRRTLVFPDVVESEMTLLEGYLAFYAHGASNRSVRCALLDETGAWVADEGNGSILFTMTSIGSTPLRRFGVANGDPPVLFISGNSNKLEAGVYVGAGNVRTEVTLNGATSLEGIVAVDGALYWVEGVPSGGDITATTKSTTADVTAPSTVSIATFTSASMLTVMGAGVVDGDVLFYVATGFSGPYWILNGTTGAKTALGGALSTPILQALPGTGALAYGVRDTGGRPIGKTDTNATLESGATHWPWSTSGGGSFGKFASQSADHEQLAVYDPNAPELVHDFVDEPWEDEPRRSFIPADHPALGLPPFLVAVRDLTL